MPESLLPRLLLGLLAGALLVVALHEFVSRPPTVRAGPRVDGPVAGASARSPEVISYLHGPGVWLVFLAADPAELPAAVRPVVELRIGGGLRLLRPPPASLAPRERWFAAGVVVPTSELAALSPVERGALLEVLAALSAGRRLSADQLVPRGIELPVERRQGLLRWVR